MGIHEQMKRELKEAKAKAEQDRAKAEQDAKLKKEQEEKAEQDRTKAEQDAKAEEARANRAKAEQDAKLKKEQEAKAEKSWKEKQSSSSTYTQQPEEDLGTNKPDDSKESCSNTEEKILERLIPYFNEIEKLHDVHSHAIKSGLTKDIFLITELCKLKARVFNNDASLCKELYEEYVAKQPLAGEEKSPAYHENTL